MSDSSHTNVKYNPLGSTTVRSESYPTVKSATTIRSGPSKDEPALITSTWGIGWVTPVLMIGCYVLALAIAFIHLFLFHYLNGKEADGPDRVAPQAYVTTASNVLANAFGFILRASLGIAFAQHLWRVLRSSSLKVSTIEELFNLRSNPLIQFKPSALRATPLLCALAAVMWVSQIVTSLPPGALTVTTTQKISFSTVQGIPTFNASFMGIGSGVDANAYSLSELTPSSTGAGFVTSGFSQNKDANLINRLARQVLVGGESFSMPTPCGPNCSYVVEFEGPYMDCNISKTTKLYNDAGVSFLVYVGAWFAPLAVSPNPKAFYNGTYSINNFKTTVLNPLQANGSQINGEGNSSVLMEQVSTICLPGRANYVVNNTWINNVQSRKISTTPIDRLINLAVATHDHVVLVPGFGATSGDGLGTAAANWSTYALGYYRDNNMNTIISSLMSWLQGGFSAFLANGDGNAAIGPTEAKTYLLQWNEQIITQTNGVAVSSGPQNGTVVDSTRFNAAFGQFNAFQTSHPSFNVTQELINDYLFNMTTSMMVTYGLWNTTANATRSSAINVYNFSQPLNLILPYFVTLLFALPFVVLGCLALFNNGVSAMDGSFMQIIATSTGSATLDRAAAGGCLGGSESMPQELKELRIQFGEFIGRDDPRRIRRTGFGVEGEVTEITKGDTYGIAKWI